MLATTCCAAAVTSTVLEFAEAASAFMARSLNCPPAWDWIPCRYRDELAIKPYQIALDPGVLVRRAMRITRSRMWLESRLKVAREAKPTEWTVRY